MVVCDVVRFALFVSIPLVGTLWWLLVATFLIEVASLFWIPAKEATVPNLVPRERLSRQPAQPGHDLRLGAGRGGRLRRPGAAVAASSTTAVPVNEVDLALYVNAATFLVSALTIVRLTEIPPRAARDRRGRAPAERLADARRGLELHRPHPLVRGLVVGMLGAFAAGGAVIGLARTFVADLGAGEPGYGLLFGAVFVGLAAGMFLGPRVLPDSQPAPAVRACPSSRRGCPWRCSP